MLEKRPARPLRYALAAAFGVGAVAVLLPVQAQTRCPKGRIYSARLKRCVPRAKVKPIQAPKVKDPKKKNPKKTLKCPKGYHASPSDLRGGAYAAFNRHIKKMPGGYGAYGEMCIEYAPSRCCSRYERQHSSGYGPAATCKDSVIAVQPGTTHPPAPYDGMDDTWSCRCREPYVKIFGYGSPRAARNERIDTFSCMPPKKSGRYGVGDMAGPKTHLFHDYYRGG